MERKAFSLPANVWPRYQPGGRQAGWAEIDISLVSHWVGGLDRCIAGFKSQSRSSSLNPWPLNKAEGSQQPANAPAFRHPAQQSHDPALLHSIWHLTETAMQLQKPRRSQRHAFFYKLQASICLRFPGRKKNSSDRFPLKSRGKNKNSLKQTEASRNLADLRILGGEVCMRRTCVAASPAVVGFSRGMELMSKPRPPLSQIRPR